MFIYAIRRLNLFLITLLTLTLISYSIVLLDPYSFYGHYNFLSGWSHYLTNLFQGNWGVTNAGVPVFITVFQLLPATLELCFSAFLLATLIGVPLGTIAGMKRGYATDVVISSLTLITFSMPIFWVAILLIMLFSLSLGWLPVSGQYNLLYEVPSHTGFLISDILLSEHPHKHEVLSDAIRHFIMPTIVLAIGPTTELIKLLRDSVSHVMTQNFIKAAYTKGLSKGEIIRRHVLKNALPPIIPKFGIQISTMMTFAIITESIFNWPGIGTWLLDSLSQNDYNAVQGGVLVIGCVVLIANIAADLIGSAMSPLTRKEWYAFR